MAKEAPNREQMEEVEARSEETYARTPEPASDAVLTVTRPAGKIVDANAEAAEMLGYSLPELMGMLVPREIVAPEVLEQTQREWVSQMQENGHYSVETVWARHLDAERLGARMSCEEAWIRVRELARRAANADQAYAALVKSPELMKTLSATPEMSRVIAEARERCNQADQALGRAMQAALRAQQQH